MTPALLASFRAPDAPLATGSPPLPITWRGRALFTEEHVEAMLGSMRLGAGLGYAARVACGLRDARDGARALEAACAACPALRREVDAAMAEGRRASAGVVGGDGSAQRGVTDHAGPGRELPPSSLSGKAEHEGGDVVHAQQPVPAATAAQGARRDLLPGAEPLPTLPPARPPAGQQEPTAAPPAAQGRPDLVRLSAEVDADEREPPKPQRSKRASEATDDDAPDWAQMRIDALDYAPGPYGWLLLQEERLRKSGSSFPRLSPWWLWTAEGFFASQKRWLLAMAGRGAGKSTILTRLAVVLGMLTDRRISPGQTWIWPFVSVLPVDAKRRLTEIQAVLMYAYHTERKITSPEQTPTLLAPDANGNEIGWVSSASTIGNVSGPSSIGATVDEEEKILFARAGEIIGSLGHTFRARRNIRGFRVSSAMTTSNTLAQSCKMGPTITNYVATIGPFLPIAVEGFLAVAEWEERGDAAAKRAADPEAARQIRAHAASLTADSWQIPTWLGNPSVGSPDEQPWAPGDAAIATRIEAAALPPAVLQDLPPWRYWLRECGSVPTGDDVAWDDGGTWEVLGDECRNASLMHAERGYE